jgi:hypothetical protein
MNNVSKIKNQLAGKTCENCINVSISTIGSICILKDLKYFDASLNTCKKYEGKENLKSRIEKELSYLTKKAKRN